MAVTTEAMVKKDLANRKITVTRQYDFAPQQVWDSWTRSEVLDQWWAPKPWRAETKKFEFKVGGMWLYAMAGPNNEKHWGLANYTKIDAPKSFDVTDSFSDENGVKAADLPETHWHVEFAKAPNGTNLTVEITATKPGDLEKMLEMGFEEGFKAGLDNLEDYLQNK